MYNKLAIRIKKLEEYKPYKRKMKPFLIDQAFYSVEEFLHYRFDVRAVWLK
jgi:hypothetical protein